jgi:uncharacterized membrane protein
MKKVLYIILLIAELVGGFGLLILATSVTDWGYFSIVTAVWAALMVLMLVKLKKSGDASGKRKIKTAIAFVMLLPAGAGLAGLGWFIWGMSSAGLI